MKIKLKTVSHNETHLHIHCKTWSTSASKNKSREKMFYYPFDVRSASLHVFYSDNPKYRKRDINSILEAAIYESE